MPLAVATPARAIPLAAIELPAVAAAAFGTVQGCDTAPGFGQPVPGSGKGSAILGGQVSQLDLIRQQQSGSGATAIAGNGLTPAAAPMACQRPIERLVMPLVMPAPAISTFQPGPGRPTSGAPEDFLASKRLPIGKTVFDEAWNRVSHEGLSRSFVAGLFGGGAPTLATLGAVNAWSNTRIRYEEDSQLYGRADYWASAGATLSRGAGDCEDIAILKMQILAAMGVPRTDMYLTVARDLTRRADHALLVVRLDRQYWVLDNATNRPLDASQSYDYQPILSFNASQKWLHGY